jgi:hypothetical protein
MSYANRVSRDRALHSLLTHDSQIGYLHIAAKKRRLSMVVSCKQRAESARNENGIDVTTTLENTSTCTLAEEVLKG